MGLFSKKSDDIDNLDINSVNNTVTLLREELLRLVSDFSKVKNEVSNIKLKNFVSDPKNGKSNFTSQLNFLDQKIASISNDVEELNVFKTSMNKDFIDQKRVEEETNLIAESNKISVSTITDFVDSIDKKIKILDSHIQNDENVSKDVKKNMSNLIKKEDERLSLIIKKLKSISLKANKEELEYESLKEDLKELPKMQRRIENVSNVIDILGESFGSKVKNHHFRLEKLEESKNSIEERLDDKTDVNLLKSKLDNFSLVIEMLSDSINKHFDDSDKRIDSLESFKEGLFSQLKSDFDLSAINTKLDDFSSVIEILSSSFNKHLDDSTKRINSLESFKEGLFSQLKSDFDLTSVNSKIENNALMLEVLSSSVNSHFGDVDKKIDEFDSKIKEEVDDISDLGKKLSIHANQIEKNSNSLDVNLDRIDDRLDKMETNLNSGLEKIDDLSEKVDKLAKIMVVLSKHVKL